MLKGLRFRHKNKALCHKVRRSVGEKYKNLTPPALRKEIYGRNLEVYKNELGPSFESLVEGRMARGDSLTQAYESVIESSTHTNENLNYLIEVMDRELK